MYERILVPVDDSESMTEVFEHAAAVASARDATVHVFHVLDDRAFLTLEDSMQEEVLANLEREAEATTDAAAAAFEAAELAVETSVVRGDPAEEILGAVEAFGADLIVMGTRQGSYTETMLGSVSQKVVAGASVPVLTVNVGQES